MGMLEELNGCKSCTENETLTSASTNYGTGSIPDNTFQLIIGQYRKLLAPNKSEEAMPVSRSGCVPRRNKKKERNKHVHNVNSSITTKPPRQKRERKEGFELRVAGVSVGQDGADQIGIVDLAGASIDSLEQLIDFVIGHFLAEVGEDCSRGEGVSRHSIVPDETKMKGNHTVAQLSHTNEPRHILIKHLETTTILLRLTGIAETTRTVENLQEGIEIDCTETSISARSSPQAPPRYSRDKTCRNTYNHHRQSSQDH